MDSSTAKPVTTSVPSCSGVQPTGATCLPPCAAAGTSAGACVSPTIASGCRQCNCMAVKSPESDRAKRCVVGISYCIAGYSSGES